MFVCIWEDQGLLCLVASLTYQCIVASEPTQVMKTREALKDIATLNLF